MKRRESFRLIPLSLAGMATMVNKAFSEDLLRYDYPNVDAYREPEKPTGEPLAIRYTKKVRDRLLWVRETQSENLLEASYAIARTVMRKGTCWYFYELGHTPEFDIFPERNGLPEIFTMGYNPEKSKDGDLFLVSVAGALHEDLKKKDILVIGAPCSYTGDALGSHLIVLEHAKRQIRPYSDIWIEYNIDTIDALMRVPGMPAPIGVVGGTIGIVTFWMMVADACRVLAREGKPVNVRGDEPKLSGKDIPWVSLHDPLMDDYFEQTLLQIEMIGAEMGNINRIAKMAVDSVLAGGRVWCYSRYYDSLAAEASTRIGGLSLTQGIYVKDGKLSLEESDFKGTSKDLVIMGIFEPDDEVDLKSLDTFRELGMKVASMGPMTRDIKIPVGRTVPKEADIHVGRMCDTYGLYAIPGFERKVAPTSGVLLTQIFYATVMEIVEEMIRRTGNIPGVFFSAALRGGREHMYRMHEIYRERGY